MDYITHYSTGWRWERKMQEKEEVQQLEAAQKRHTDSERRASETRLPQLETRRLSNSGFNSNVQHSIDRQHPTSNTVELDSVPVYHQNRAQEPPTPPASITEPEYNDMSNGPQTNLSHWLQAQIQARDRDIEKLETELQSTKTETLRLRAERDEYERAHIQAIRNSNQQEAGQLRQHVDQLAECLNVAKAREKELEADLDKAMSEKQELRRKLHRTEEERSDREHDLERLRATTGREARHESTLEDTHSMPVTGLSAGGHGDNLGIQGGIQGTVGSQAGREASASESHSIPRSGPSARTSATQTSKKKFALSVPRGKKKDYGTAFFVVESLRRPGHS
ncbi:MAG: hypothetical protein LQ343_007902 [Gyalolechia ehrenbergii]|nr:MAG: hypothetical protein LQ343_007902 [Gyalolechia ehrenbergii]